MKSLDILLFLLLGLVSFAAVLGLTVALLRGARARRRARRRVVEKPNSHYTAPLARNIQIRHRWHDIALDRVHEINRGEVVRLLAKADAVGVEALRASERTFLDQMAKIAPGRPDPAPREPTGPVPPLRERPA
jgi:hypothetical protein